MQGDLNATADKEHLVTSPADTRGLWPVYKGVSLDLWKPDTGKYYAWAEPEHIVEFLQDKLRSSKNNADFFESMNT